MTHVDLFSGIGGFALASTWVWGDEYRNLGHSEIEPYACKVYHRHFPKSPCLGNVTKIRWEAFRGKVDLLTGGFPCQPHSISGKGKGSMDERDLWCECFRAICGVRPHYALFENVSGLFVSDNGRFFNRVLTDLAEIGYDVEWQTIPACAINNAPHTRERVWILAYSNGIRRNEDRIFKAGHTKQYRSWPSTTTYGLGNIEQFAKGQVAELVGMDNGIPGELDKRLHGLGNAIVPQVAQVILEAIKAQQ